MQNLSTGPGLAVVPRVLEFGPGCKQLALILVVMHAVGFAVTWYRVWWDTIIAILVAAWGYYALFDPNGQQLNARFVVFVSQQQPSKIRYAGAYADAVVCVSMLRCRLL